MSWKRWAVGGVLVGGLAAGVLGVRHRMAVVARMAKHGLQPVPTSRTPVPMTVAEVIYDQKFGDGWQDWGWGPHQYPNSAPLRINTSGFGGVIFHHESLNRAFGGVLFRYKAPPAWGMFLLVSARYERSSGALPDVAIEPRHVAELADGWREVFVPWEEIDPQNVPIDRIMIASRLPEASGWIELDKVGLTAPGATSAAKEDTRDVDLAVMCEDQTHPISPLIYGISQGEFASGGTANRIGGNTTSRLNWDLPATWNTGSDWFFENVKGSGDIWSWIDGAVQHHAVTAITVPTIGWVAKDAIAVGFPRSKFPKQKEFDTYRPEAGNGVAPDGTPIKPGPPTETSVPAPPELIGRWVRKARAVQPTQSLRMYILDNEPALWDKTHRDVHPDPVGYDELLDRTERYAAAIREADPDALIAGPAEWGWTNYFTSAKDRGAHGLIGFDRLSHGGTPLIAWYLDQLATYEKKTGVRALDVLDVHFYPAAQNLYGQNARTDPEGAALRLRSTRALWDPTYKDESWIDEPVRLIPRLKDWIRENYPGRKVQLGEWSFGADDHISGGLATAEALGRFGQQGLDAAFFWGGPKEPTAAYWAFRAFRNFDGHGAHFLDISVPTREAPGISLFASRDASGTHLVLVLLNLDPDSVVKPNIKLDSCGAVSKQRVFRYAAGSKALEQVDDKDLKDGLSLAPYSLTVLDLDFSKTGH